MAILWVVIGGIIGCWLPAFIDPGFYDVDLSYDPSPIEEIIPLAIIMSSIGATVIIPPVTVRAVSKFFTRIANKWHIRIWHLWASLVYLLLTTTLISKALLNVVPLLLLFVYLLLGIALSHLLAYSYREKIKPNFYKYLEYIYVIVAVGGIASASSHIAVLYEQHITKLNNRLGEVNKVLSDGSCEPKGMVLPDACYDIDNRESVEKEINKLSSEKPQKISATLSIFGYIALTIALMVKILKISGELYRWHNKQE